MITARYTKEDRSEAEISIDGAAHSGCQPHHWQWIDMVRAGVTPEPYVAPEKVVVVPEVVTNLQARKAIRAAGLKPDVDAAIAAGSEELQEEWQFAQEIRRDSARIAELAGVLGMSDTQLDALFIAAQDYPR